jgi:hypothetical protein
MTAPWNIDDELAFARRIADAAERHLKSLSDEAGVTPGEVKSLRSRIAAAESAKGELANALVHLADDADTRAQSLDEAVSLIKDVKRRAVVAFPTSSKGDSEGRAAFLVGAPKAVNLEQVLEQAQAIVVAGERFRKEMDRRRAGPSVEKLSKLILKLATHAKQKKAEAEGLVADVHLQEALAAVRDEVHYLRAAAKVAFHGDEAMDDFRAPKEASA